MNPIRIAKTNAPYKIKFKPDPLDITSLFGILPLAALSSLTKQEIVVYTILRSFQGKKGKCWPSQQAISDRIKTECGLNYSRRKVSDIVSSLRKKNWIITKKTSRNLTYQCLDFPASCIRGDYQKHAACKTGDNGSPPVGGSNIKEQVKQQEEPNRRKKTEEGTTSVPERARAPEISAADSASEKDVSVDFIPLPLLFLESSCRESHPVEIRDMPPQKSMERKERGRREWAI